MAIVYKKTWPDMFEKDKNMIADFRCADFGLEEGDEICYQEWDPETKKYTGRSYTKKVKGLLKCESPTRYWTKEQLDKDGLYLMVFEYLPKSSANPTRGINFDVVIPNKNRWLRVVGDVGTVIVKRVSIT